MSSYLVTYDLGGPGRDYEGLYEYLRSTGTYSRILESVWIVVSNTTSSSAIRIGAEKHLDQNDKIFVAKLTGESSWRGLPDETAKWIKDCINL